MSVCKFVFVFSSHIKIFQENQMMNAQNDLSQLHIWFPARLQLADSTDADAAVAAVASHVVCF